MKRCPKCKENKETIDFGKETINKDGLRSWCKACIKVYNASYKLAHPEKRKALVRQCYYRRVDEIHEMLGGKCAECGLADPAVLQVDHVYGDGNQQRRNDGISNHSRRIRDSLRNGVNLGWQLLCGNCHNKKSFYDRRKGAGWVGE